jgi:hypothetical protein
MEAVLTRVLLNEGAESDWAGTMRDRMTAAEGLDSDAGTAMRHDVVYAGGRFTGQ